MTPEDEKMKTVTIRGIHAPTYTTFSKVVKLQNMNVGEAITKLMNDVMVDFEEVLPELQADSRSKAPQNKLTIDRHEVLEITEQDLTTAKARITFSRIQFLDFQPDITAKSFKRFIRVISRCGKVRVPSSIPKLQVLSKISRSGEGVELYDPETGEVVETFQSSHENGDHHHSHVDIHVPPIPPVPPVPPLRPPPPRGVRPPRPPHVPDEEWIFDEDEDEDEDD